jgi:hypothetical protein
MDFAVSFKRTPHLRAADLNGDNSVDLVATSYRGVGYMKVLLGNGDRTFAPVLTSAAGMPHSIALADMADGRQDVVQIDIHHSWSENDEDVYDSDAVVLLGNGTFHGRLRRHLLRRLRLPLPRHAERLQRLLERIRRTLAVQAQHRIQHILGLRMLGHGAIQRLGKFPG